MITVSGVEASLRWGYQLAAKLGNWTLTRDNGACALTASIKTMDTFRISQRPLVFIAPHAKGEWRFHVLELQISGASVTGMLGPREISNALSIRSA